MTKRTYRYRIYPSRSQTRILNQTLEECRRLYNSTLALRQDAWRNDRSEISLYQTNKMLTQWKKDNLFSKQIHSKVLQNVQERADTDIKNPSTTDFPSPKKPERYRSFTYSQSGFSLIGNRRLRLSKIGKVKIKVHRPMPREARRLTIKRTVGDKWYACFEVEMPPEGQPEPSKKSVGICLNKWYTFHDAYEGLPWSYVLENVWSNKPNKDGLKARKLKERVLNSRRNFVHQECHRLTSQYSIIAISKEGNDWDDFIEYLLYKASVRGTRVILVGADHACGLCGANMGEIVHGGRKQCPYCGRWRNVYRNRDIALNALRNSLKKLPN